MKKSLFTLLLTCVILLSHAQSNHSQALFYGYVEAGKFEPPSVEKKKREKSPERLSDVKIYTYIAETLISVQNARETGFYALLLNSGQKYRVVFEKDGYFCKCFEMDCSKMELNGTEDALKCLTDVTLFKKVDDANLLNLCKVPFAKCSFDPDKKEMLWDLGYTELTRDKFHELAQPYYINGKN
ncbi:MAG: hypothetical protein IT223_12190 [Crocinitomicaceae bacterium]|nr:hypothetical protein [Crocinitomicaceae bacterium]